MGARGGGPMGGMGGGSNAPSMRKAMVVFKSRAYTYLWFSNLAGFTGMQMQMVARGLLAWELTESFGAVGAISLSFGLPMLFFSLIGGAVADRVDKRNLAQRTQLGVGLIALLTAVLVATEIITIEILFGVGLLQGTLFAFSMPARTPLMAEVVDDDQLMSAIAMGNAAMNATRLVGPAVAGALIGFWDIEAAYFAQAGMYAISVLLYFGVPSQGVPGDGGGFGMQRRPGVFREIGEGLRYVGHEKSLLLLLFLGFLLTLIGMPYIMLLPGFVQQGLGRGPSDFGLLLTVSGAGALVGSLFVASLVDFPWKGALQFLSGIAAGGGLILLGIASNSFGFTGALGAIVVLGLAFTMYQTLNQTMVMAETKPEYYGRVMSIYMLTFSAMPLMAAPLGIVADRIGGAANVFMGQGVVIIAALVLVTLINPSSVFGRVKAPAMMPMMGRGGPMGGGGRPPAAGKPAAAAASPSNGSTPPAPEPAAEAPTIDVAVPTPAPEPALASTASPVGSASREPREYMAGPVAPPLSNGDAARNYMGDDRAEETAPSAPAQNGGTSNGTTAGASDANGSAPDDTATAERPAHASNGRAAPPPDPQHARTRPGGARAEGDGSRAESDVGSGTGGNNRADAGNARNGSGGSAPTSERVELPRKPRAGMIERTAVAAITATMIAGALTSLFFRGSSGRR